MLKKVVLVARGLGDSNIRKHRSGGFTIIELLLATAVFSVTLLIALNGFLQVGRLFYKGVSNTQTQNASRQILNEVTRSLQLSPEVSLLQSANSGGGQYYFYCLGNSRYTYTRGEDGSAIKVDSSQSPSYNTGANGGNFGLFKDSLAGSNACESPVSMPLDTGNGVDLLGNKMRLGQLAITSEPTSPNLYNITVTVIYGDNESLDFPDGVSRPDTARCSGNLSNQQFCAVSTLTTSIFKGLQP